jgi:hypothetical protein
MPAHRFATSEPLFACTANSNGSPKKLVASDPINSLQR